MDYVIINPLPIYIPELDTTKKYFSCTHIYFTET